MLLTKHIVSEIRQADVPGDNYFNLPEKVLQFGTGMLLRGLPDYYIDKANKQGKFNGRVVIVKSTGDDIGAFQHQDCLYTHNIYGIEKGTPVKKTIINASVSRVLAANKQWNEILECAADPSIEIIISNTTEVGIVLIEDDINSAPPVSFPGKLLAVLFKRYSAFNGAADKGFVIVPTELIADNGIKLKEIVLELAKKNKLDNSFIRWVDKHNHFCNSLVDRIVTGNSRPSGDIEDQLSIVSEPYSLWAIEASKTEIKEKLSFAETDNTVVVVPDITLYRELKLRLLNGTHTFNCGLAYLAGFNTVKQAMSDPDFAAFAQSLVFEEIVPATTSDIVTEESAKKFATATLERFRNPYIEHLWINITLKYSTKMASRNVPLIANYIERNDKAPERMALGFAAHILFMKVAGDKDGKYYGKRNNETYPVSDDNAAFYAGCWSNTDISEVVRTVLSAQNIWGADMFALKHFHERVTFYLNSLIQNGAKENIKSASIR